MFSLPAMSDVPLCVSCEGAMGGFSGPKCGFAHHCGWLSGYLHGSGFGFSVSCNPISHALGNVAIWMVCGL